MAFLDAATPLFPMASHATAATATATPTAATAASTAFNKSNPPRTSACAPPRPMALTGRIDVSNAPGRFSLAWGGPPGFNMQPIRRLSASSLSDMDDDEDGAGSVVSLDELTPVTVTTTTAAAVVNPSMAHPAPAAAAQQQYAAPTPKIHVPRPSAAKLERLKDGRCGGNSCHQCKSTKEPHHLFVCYNNVQGLPRAEAKRRTKARHKACRKKYCARCLVKFYRINPAQIKEPVWFCPGCQGFCSCASCRKKRIRQNVATRPVVRPGSPVPLELAELLTSHGADRDFAVVCVDPPLVASTPAAAKPAVPSRAAATATVTAAPAVAKQQLQGAERIVKPAVAVVPTPVQHASTEPVSLSPLPIAPLGTPTAGVAKPSPLALSPSAAITNAATVEDLTMLPMLSGPSPMLAPAHYNQGFAVHSDALQHPQLVLDLPAAAAAEMGVADVVEAVEGGGSDVVDDDVLQVSVSGSSVLHALADQDPLRQHITEIVDDDASDYEKIAEIASVLRDVAMDPRFCCALEDADFFLS